MLHPLGLTRNGTQVSIDLVRSDAGRQIAKQPRLLGLIIEAIDQINITASRPMIEHNMKRVVGYDYVVPTTSDDGVFYGKLVGDEHFTRFIKNADPKQTTYLVFSLTQLDDKDYRVDAVEVGRNRPQPPELALGANEVKKSRNFWAAHALVPENRSIQASTITKHCPY